VNGLLVIDKPGGMTSRDVVNRVQRWFPRKTKIGHTGTLDPLATGVLVICIGQATRLADYVQAMGKTYVSRFRLGAVSTTDDADGIVTERVVLVPPTREQVEAALGKFVGTIEQVPPAVSALKIAGQRAHTLVRQGKDVRLSARTVRIDSIRLLRNEWPFLDVEVDCGKGTYIRSIARDLGDALGCGGLVETLRRTRIGPFTAERAMGLEADPASVKLLPMAEAVSGLPHAKLDADQVRRIRNGQRIVIDERLGYTRGELVVLNESGELVAVGMMHSNTNYVFVPHIVFHEQASGAA
jgi:tRNA pseudouridine55 synthase